MAPRGWFPGGSKKWRDTAGQHSIISEVLKSRGTTQYYFWGFKVRWTSTFRRDKVYTQNPSETIISACVLFCRCCQPGPLCANASHEYRNVMPFSDSSFDTKIFKKTFEIDEIYQKVPWRPLPFSVQFCDYIPAHSRPPSSPYRSDRETSPQGNVLGRTWRGSIPRRGSHSRENSIGPRSASPVSSSTHSRMERGRHHEDICHWTSVGGCKSSTVGGRCRKCAAPQCWSRNENFAARVRWPVRMEPRSAQNQGERVEDPMKISRKNEKKKLICPCGFFS